MSPTEVLEPAVPQNAIALQEKSDLLLASVLRFKITDQATMEEAGRLSKALSELDNQIHSSFDPIIETAHQTHKKAIAQRNIHLEPIQKGIAHLKLQCRDYLLAEQRRQREAEEQRRREQEEAERKHQEEVARIEREQREAEEARLNSQREADRLLELAAEMERQGLKAESDALLSKAVEATPELKKFEPMPLQPPPALKLAPPAPAIKSVPGLGSRKVWKWRVTDKTLIPREYLTVNEIVLNALAKTAKSHPEQIPGIEFYEDLEMRRSS